MHLLCLAALAASALTVEAAITIDLSYVDTQSTTWTRFRNWVNQALAGNPGYEFSATDAAMAARITGQANYCTLAVSMVEAQVSAAEARIAANQNPVVAGDSYLQAGPMIGDLALTYDWCASQVSASQRTRWAAYAERTIANIWTPSQAQWGGRAAAWTGWGTNDPANNYYYSFLRATMYWDSPQQRELISYLQTQKLPPLQAYFSCRRVAAARKAPATAPPTAVRALPRLARFDRHRLRRGQSAPDRHDFVLVARDGADPQPVCAVR